MILKNEVRDRDLRMCTITAVETKNDLSISKVYVTFLGKNYNQEKGMEALERSKGFIRNLLAKKLKVRKCPELHFVLDTSLEYGNKIEIISAPFGCKETVNKSLDNSTIIILLSVFSLHEKD